MNFTILLLSIIEMPLETIKQFFFFCLLFDIFLCGRNTKLQSLKIVSINGVVVRRGVLHPVLNVEWSTLIGPDPPDTQLSLVESYCAGAKVYVITTHDGMISGFHVQKESIIGHLMP